MKKIIHLDQVDLSEPNPKVSVLVNMGEEPLFKTTGRIGMGQSVGLG